MPMACKSTANLTKRGRIPEAPCKATSIIMPHINLHVVIHSKDQFPFESLGKGSFIEKRALPANPVLPYTVSTVWEQFKLLQ